MKKRIQESELEKKETSELGKRDAYNEKNFKKKKTRLITGEVRSMKLCNTYSYKP